MTDYGVDRRMARGLTCSLLLHIVAAWFLWRPPHLPEPRLRPSPRFALPIDLVTLSEETVSPAAEQKSALPQARARETTERPNRAAVPEPKQAPDPTADDPLSKKLRELSQWNQPAPPLPASPNLQDGSGLSNVTAGNGNGRAGNPTLGLKDYLRAQIERRWVLPEGAALRNDWVVVLHLSIKDGRVVTADIVDDPRMGRDPAFREFAFSARNAALLSSPLNIPPQFVELARDVSLDFNPRQVQQ